jgi:hypothetical protein
MKFSRLPSLAEIKSELDTTCAKFAGPIARIARLKKQIDERNDAYIPKLKEYTGPIEEVRPGDILSVERQEEYRTFMRSKHPGVSTKMWGINETWKDNGARPFATKLQTGR